MMASGERGGRCPICGTALIGDCKFRGRCAKHQTTKLPDIKLTADGNEARRHHMSYGKYMQAKEAGKI